MKTVVSCLLVIALLWAIVPKSAGDLPNYNDGTTGTVNVGTINVRTNVNAAAGVFTNSLTLNGVAVTTNGVNKAGDTMTGALLVPANTTTNVSIASSATPNTGIGFAAATITMIRSGVAGQSQFSSSGNNSSLTLGFSGTPVTLTSAGTAVLALGVASATPATQTIQGQSGSGTDKDGASLLIEAGNQTGAGNPLDIIYSTGLYTNGSGSSLRPYSERGRIVGRPCAITNATATSFQRFTMATNTYAGIKVFATVSATDASFNKQSISSDLRVDAVNVSGTITATASETDNTLAANTGTLTIAYTVVDEGSNVLAIRANANSSLTTPTVKIKWVIQSINSDGAITVTPVQL